MVKDNGNMVPEYFAGNEMANIKPAKNVDLHGIEIDPINNIDIKALRENLMDIPKMPLFSKEMFPINQIDKNKLRVISNEQYYNNIVADSNN
jgi:hypothetical protein